MPLSPDERARIIETQTLKSEIATELASGAARSRLSDFSKQLILLIVGFVLTTLAGGLLTSYWKSREWYNQQSYLRQQRALDKKYAVIDKLFKDVALTTAAAQDVLASYYQSDVSAKEIDERMTNWHKTSRDWRVASKVLSADLASNFENPEVGRTFQEIINKRRQLGNMITNLPKCKPGASVSKETEQQLKQANDLANQISDVLQKCGGLTTCETKASSVVKDRLPWPFSYFSSVLLGY